MTLAAGFIAAVCVILAADHAAGGPWAFPFACLVFAGAVALALKDGQRR